MQVAFDIKSSSSGALKDTAETAHVSPTISPARAGRGRVTPLQPPTPGKGEPSNAGPRGDPPRARL